MKYLSLILLGDAKEKENNITALHKRAEETPQLLQSDRKSLALQHIEYLADLGADISKYVLSSLLCVQDFLFHAGTEEKKLHIRRSTSLILHLGREPEIIPFINKYIYNVEV